MKKILLLSLLICLSVCACGKKEPSISISPEDLAKIESQMNPKQSERLKLKMETLTVECGDCIYADASKYVTASDGDYDSIKMHLFALGEITEDYLTEVPNASTKITFEDAKTNTYLTLPVVIQDTISPEVTSYLGSYQFYLRDANGKPLKDYSSSSMYVYITDFQVEYNDKSWKCTLKFADTDSLPDMLKVSHISSDFLPGTYKNEIIITDLGGNETRLPISIELLDEAEPSAAAQDAYVNCVCMEKCSPDQPDPSCSVCVEDVSLCIGIDIAGILNEAFPEQTEPATTAKP